MTRPENVRWWQSPPTVVGLIALALFLVYPIVRFGPWFR